MTANGSVTLDLQSGGESRPLSVLKQLGLRLPRDLWLWRGVTTGLQVYTLVGLLLIVCGTFAPLGITFLVLGLGVLLGQVCGTLGGRPLSLSYDHVMGLHGLAAGLLIDALLFLICQAAVTRSGRMIGLYVTTSLTLFQGFAYVAWTYVIPVAQQ